MFFTWVNIISYMPSNFSNKTNKASKPRQTMP